MRKREAKHTLLGSPAVGEIYRRPTQPASIHIVQPLKRSLRIENRRRSSLSPTRALLIFLLIIACASLYYSWNVEQVGRTTVVSPLSFSPADVVFAPPALETPETNDVMHVIRRKESVDEVFLRHGLTKVAADQAEKALAALPKDQGASKFWAEGKKVFLSLSKNGELLSVKIQESPVLEARLIRSENGFKPEIVREKPPAMDRVSMGVIKNSFSAAASKAGVSAVIVDEFVDIFSDRVEFNKDVRSGDRFTVIYRDVADGKGLPKDHILAAALSVGGETFTASRYIGTDGKARYFDENGKPIGASFLRYPLSFTRISSYVTDSRFHPVLHRRRAHNGVDFAAPVGTPVRSVANGRVVFAGYKGPSGIMVLIRHDDRWSTAYLHLSKITRGIVRGTSVSKGDLIGAVGSTGLSTGPHLHYSLFDRGKYVDPLGTKLPIIDEVRGGNAIRKKYLARVLFTLEHYQRIDVSALTRTGS